MSKNIDDLVERFNDGDYSVLDYFGRDYQVFFKFLERRNKLTEIDPTGNDADEYQNELLLHFYQTDIDKFHFWCDKLLNDIEFSQGKVYFVGDPTDLADLFCDNRDVSRETISNILEGSLDFDWFDSFDINVYDNVIHDLNLKNLNELKKIFLRELQGRQIETDDGEISVTPENIDSIFLDGKLVNHILDEELDELRSELRSLYHNAERSALEDDYYEEVWNELDEFFVSEHRVWVNVKKGFKWDKDGNKQDRFIEQIKIPIRNFDKYVSDYLDTNKNYSNSTLEYHGNYVDLLKDGGDCLRARFPDYADSRKIETNINDMFGDYIS